MTDNKDKQKFTLKEKQMRVAYLFYFLVFFNWTLIVWGF